MNPQYGARPLPSAHGSAPSFTDLMMTWASLHPFLAAALVLAVILFMLKRRSRDKGGLRGVADRAWRGTWVFDTGLREYRRIVSFDADGPIVKKETRDERRVIAAEARKTRFEELVIYSVMALTCAWFVQRCMTESWPVVFPSRDFGGVVTLCLFLLAACCLVWALWVIPTTLIKEGLYLSSFARMRGARVIDPARRSAEIPKEVYEQKIHGSAGPQTADEAKRSYGGTAEPSRQTWEN